MSNPGQPPDPVVAKAYWDLNLARRNFSAQVNADYGKWLLVTLASTHLAGIYLVSQPSVPDSVRLDPSSYWPFVIGLCAVLVCGLLTWMNWALSARLYDGWMNPHMLVNTNCWPQEASKRMKIFIRLTFYLPIFIGLLSAGCILWGASAALGSIKPHVNVAVPQTNKHRVDPLRAAKPPTKPVPNPGAAAKNPK